ncbi:MAG: protein-L-isoaspartate O-methyltransferase [Deltaproteobacteria bacterium RIFCSPLOWO2_12_FULL_40_28]|nr:MAG: protein-L-isoaspartate O-methyltransferase [Deltaproteobacteria bacterium RIFCSPHIGHO2_02_FULL_40_28]OGQ20196.1 MAG: protein-L-isoaspartate O-methyltransferase [Deltaproteobacteria bacterium RIFCSPHIGHO2_12_FULL_40_32]OGQ40187.1 MAG: protein-L-isoaspartate O-methyltransferase [Deltaproteobacteria bacterium RIFCSPLOWO2_02_FULL_40_36]OGQ54751.1 MAG: protein-L-isoaspartate O-methyltransferase [Deltaproteobacteria bacterium RIFCSPLOWO2_12_FULL_40_28]
MREAKSLDYYAVARRRMVERHLLGRDIVDKRVIEALFSIPRHLFVDEALQSQAYGDYPLGIGEGQTISQPYIVAKMTQSLNLTGSEKVLEIGTGCGYQTAVFSLLAKQVYTIERIKNLAFKARHHLKVLRLTNIVLRIGDGSMGWEDMGPFDAILVAAASPVVPKPLVDQLADGGRLVMPVGTEDVQTLVRISKKNNQVKVESLGDCRFVKLVGTHGWHRRDRTRIFPKRSVIDD